jgi:hypothetical protein
MPQQVVEPALSGTGSRSSPRHSGDARATSPKRTTITEAIPAADTVSTRVENESVV